MSIEIQTKPNTQRQVHWLQEIRACKSGLKMSRQLVADISREATSVLDSAMKDAIASRLVKSGLWSN